MKETMVSILQPRSLQDLLNGPEKISLWSKDNVDLLEMCKYVIEEAEIKEEHQAKTARRLGRAMVAVDSTTPAQIAAAAMVPPLPPVVAAATAPAVPKSPPRKRTPTLTPPQQRGRIVCHNCRAEHSVRECVEICAYCASQANREAPQSVITCVHSRYRR